MLFKICLLFSLIHTFGLLVFAVTATGPPLYNQTKISECAAKGGECDENRGRPVCGTDGQTYPTRCHLIRAQCSGHQVSLKHRGTCKDACLASRAYALAHRKAQSKDLKFVPKCRSDGSYAPVQCLDSVGCWCVNPQGKPIPNTRVDYGYARPTCAQKSKSNQRRSSPRKLGVQTKKSCLKEDRLVFNGNVIRIFLAEYTRSRQSTHNEKPVTLSDKMITDWKFSLLDSNHNRILEKFEYRDLKRIVKKIIKPKRCARSFIKFCDMDRDERITRNEWNNCLAKEFLPDDFEEEIEEYDEDPDYAHFDGGDFHNSNAGKNNQLGAISSILRPADSRSQSVFSLQEKTTLDLKQENDPGLHENESESDCLSDRLAAEEEQRAGSQAIYIPECTPDGRYQRIQCYKSEWCWCVNEDTGKNIPGTSTKNKRPQCDSTVTTIRPMKGCPEPRKTEFLHDLKQYLKSKLPKLNFETELWSQGNEDELIATKIFVYLDKNKNKQWERKEWKTFRELVMPIKNLRKCGKKMPRYCDVNSDRKITLTEWLNCLQAQRLTSSQHLSQSATLHQNNHDQLRQTTKAPELQNSSKQSRIGQNPFDSILKSD